MTMPTCHEARGMPIHVSPCEMGGCDGMLNSYAEERGERRATRRAERVHLDCFPRSQWDRG